MWGRFSGEISNIDKNNSITFFNDFSYIFTVLSLSLMYNTLQRGGGGVWKRIPLTHIFVLSWCYTPQI